MKFRDDFTALFNNQQFKNVSITIFDFFCFYFIFWIAQIFPQQNSDLSFIDSDNSPVYDKIASDEDSNSLNNNEQQKKFKLDRKTKQVGFSKNHLLKYFRENFSYQKINLLIIYYNHQLKYNPTTLLNWL